MVPLQIFVDCAPYDPRNGHIILVRERVKRVVVSGRDADGDAGAELF